MRRDESGGLPPIAILGVVVAIVVLVAYIVLSPMLASKVAPVNPCPASVCGGNPPPAQLPFTVRTPVVFTLTQFSFTMSVGMPIGQLNVSAPPPSASLATSIALWGVVTLVFPNGVTSIYNAGSQASPWMTLDSASTKVATFSWWQSGPHGSYTITVAVSARWAGCAYPSTSLDCSVKTGTGQGAFTI